VARFLDRRDMDEHVAAAAVRLDESKPFTRVEIGKRLRQIER